MLVFVGTSHRLPEGPERLSKILDRLISRLNGPPRFIAVEGTRSHAEHAMSSEDELARELEEKLRFSTQASRVMSRLPHYEGRAALDRSAESPVIWLTEGYEDSTTASDYVTEFQQLLGMIVPGNSTSREDILTVHSEAELWSLSTRIDSDRECHMELRLQAAVEAHLQNKPGYGIVVVGGCHLRREPGTLYDRFRSLEGRRIWCSRDWEWNFDKWMASDQL